MGGGNGRPPVAWPAHPRMIVIADSTPTRSATMRVCSTSCASMSPLSSLVTVGSSCRFSLSNESVRSTSEPEKPPCSLDTCRAHSSVTDGIRLNRSRAAHGQARAAREQTLEQPKLRGSQLEPAEKLQLRWHFGSHLPGALREVPAGAGSGKAR